MPLPTQRQLEVPLLRLIESRGGEAKPKDLYGPLARLFPQLTAHDLNRRMDSTGAAKWENHVQWVRQKLVESGDLDGSTHGTWKITDGGRARLRDAPTDLPHSSDEGDQTQAHGRRAEIVSEGSEIFTWIPIHRETVRRMLDLPDAQAELLAILREMDEKGLTVISLKDRSENESFPLGEIDPLTFLSSFNRGITDANRRDNWRFLKEKWNLSAKIPDDFAGIPIVNNMSSWFFSYARERAKNHVDLLWQLVRQAAGRPLREVDEELFEKSRQLRKVTINNLSMGLFWINPAQYLACDRKTRAYVGHRGVGLVPADYRSYGEWLRQVSSVFSDDYPKLSYDAQVWATEEGVDDDDDTEGDDIDVKSPRRYWLVAPGRKAKRWNEFYEQGIIGIDWEELTDLMQYADKEDIQRQLQQHDGSDLSRVNDTRACWDFLRVMRPGDVVFAKLGIAKVVGHGVVTGDYRFDRNRSSFKHIRPMKWRGKGEWELPEDTRLPMKTLTDITKYPDLVERISKLVGLDLSGEHQAPALTTIQTLGSDQSYWWLNANPQIWSFEDLEVGALQTYTSHNENGNKRQKYKYFQEVKPGDLVVGYVTSPQREIVGICRITKGLHGSEQSERIEFEKVERLEKPVLYEALKGIPELEKCEPLINHQGSLFKLQEEEYEVIRSLIDEANPAEIPSPERYTKQMAMDGLFIAEAQLDEALDALREKRNIVLQGPPGVGKTFVARRLAKALIGSDDPQRIEMIQFHQSYSYEDFIQGFRPTSKGTFDLRYGVFHQFCRRAQRDEASRHPYVFIIDEINRGNLSKIFGELMMLIEADKRGSEFAIPLAYANDSNDKFYIPDNLHFIGTMNTADRSLAMVDYALRRRFRFLSLRPEFKSSAFREYLDKKGADHGLVRQIVAKMITLNEIIAADTKNLGPGYEIGHSYFCPRDGTAADENWYRRVVQSEIVPLLQEYWFDDEKRVEQQRAALLS
jgi:5-methylcytosine-specific restriction enzyme B